MTYTANTPILGAGTVSAEAINAWFADRGPVYAPRYAPDGQYWPAPASIGADIVSIAIEWGANHDLVAAQILHESAAWQSAIVRDKNNPSGLGAVNDNAYAGAIAFATPRDGIRATIAHLLVYAVGDGPWAAHDPRYTAVKAAGWLGAAPTLGGLNGRWAWPGTTYGESIATLANLLVDYANNSAWTKEPVMSGDDSRFRWVPDLYEFGYPSPGTRGRSGKPIDYLIVHITEGADSLQWLVDRHESSAHYLTWRDGTPRAQMVREADAAWTAGNRDYNERGINVEFERFANNPWTPSEYRNAAATVLPMLRRHNIPLTYLGRDSAGKRGLIAHADVPDGSGGWGGTTHHVDPGPRFDWPTFMAMLHELAAEGDADGVWRIAGNPFGPFGWRLGFRGFVQTLAQARYPEDINAAALSIVGWPMEMEHLDADGRTRQRCERVTLVYDPTAAVPWDVVLSLPEAVTA